MNYKRLAAQYERDMRNAARKHSPLFKKRVTALLRSTGIRFDRLVMGMGGWALVEKPKAIPYTHDDDSKGFMEGNDLLEWAAKSNTGCGEPDNISAKSKAALKEVYEILEYLNSPGNGLDVFDLKF